METLKNDIDKQTERMRKEVCNKAIREVAITAS